MPKISYKVIIELAEQRNLYQEFSIEKKASAEDIEKAFEENNFPKDDCLLEYTILSTPKYKDVYDQALSEFSQSGNSQDIESPKESKKNWKRFLLKFSIPFLAFILALISIIGSPPKDSFSGQKNVPVGAKNREHENPSPEYLDSVATSTPQKSVENYFSYIQKKDFKRAFSLFGKEKQINAGGFSEFREWLSDFEGIQDIKITFLDDLSMGDEKVFMAEFKISFLEKESLDSKWLFYIHPMEGGWVIFKSLVLYENGWRDYACDLHEGFELCSRVENDSGSEQSLKFLEKHEELKKSTYLIPEKNIYNTREDGFSINGQVSENIKNITLSYRNGEVALEKIILNNGKKHFTNSSSIEIDSEQETSEFSFFIISPRDMFPGENVFLFKASAGDEIVESRVVVNYQPNPVIGENRIATHPEYTNVSFLYPRGWHFSLYSSTSEFPIYSIFNFNDSPQIIKVSTLEVSKDFNLSREGIEFFTKKMKKEMTLDSIKNFILEDVEKYKKIHPEEVKIHNVLFENIPGVVIEYVEPLGVPIRERALLFYFVEKEQLFSFSYTATLDRFDKEKAEKIFNSLEMNNIRYSFF